MTLAPLALALTLVTAGQAPPSAPTADDWTVDVRTSAIDGRATFAASLLSESALVDAIGRPQRAILTLTCEGRGARDVLLSWPGQSGFNTADVDARLDDGPVRQWFFQPSDRLLGPVVFTGSGNWHRFREAVAGGDRLTMRANGQETAFAMGDVAAVYARADQVCR